MQRIVEPEAASRAQRAISRISSYAWRWSSVVFAEETLSALCTVVDAIIWRGSIPREVVTSGRALDVGLEILADEKERTFDAVDEGLSRTDGAELGALLNPKIVFLTVKLCARGPPLHERLAVGHWCNDWRDFVIVREEWAIPVLRCGLAVHHQFFVRHVCGMLFAQDRYLSFMVVSFSFALL